MEFNFEKLEVWQRAISLLDEFYKVADTLPTEENYILRPQLVRAAISVPLNIAEGSGRRYKKEFAQFIRVSVSSLLEALTCLKIALRRNYISDGDYSEIAALIRVLYFKLIKLEKSLKK